MLDAPAFAIPQFPPPGQWTLSVSKIQDRALRLRLDEVVSRSLPDKLLSLFCALLLVHKIQINSCTLSLRTNVRIKALPEFLKNAGKR